MIISKRVALAAAATGLAVTALTATAPMAEASVQPAASVACGNYIDHPGTTSGYVLIRHWVPCKANTIKMYADVAYGYDTHCQSYAFSSKYDASALLNYVKDFPAQTRGLKGC